VYQWRKNSQGRWDPKNSHIEFVSRKNHFVETYTLKTVPIETIVTPPSQEDFLAQDADPTKSDPYQ
jgi:hypothetical protein